MKKRLLLIFQKGKPMSIKSKGRRIGRMIRRLTGLELPIAMKIGKMISQKKLESEMVARFPGVMESYIHNCADGCCSYPVYTIKGKRYSLSLNYRLSEEKIAKELC